MSDLTLVQIKDLKILADFIKLFCHARHDRQFRGQATLPGILCDPSNAKDTLCLDCAKLLDHGVKKIDACPLKPKPTCRRCHIHCYTPEYRQQIREIMAYSGRKMLLRGRLDYLWHYYL